MTPVDAKRRLLRHGITLFLLGLLTGFVVPLTTNPRMALSAHLEGLLNGMFVLLLGLAWSELRMSRRAAAAAFWLVLYAAYVNWASVLLAAIFGTGRSTPIAGAGHAGAPWQENLVDFGLVSLSLAIVVACALLLHGLRGRGDERG